MIYIVTIKISIESVNSQRKASILRNRRKFGNNFVNTNCIHWFCSLKRFFVTITTCLLCVIMKGVYVVVMVLWNAFISVLINVDFLICKLRNVICSIILSKYSDNVSLLHCFQNFVYVYRLFYIRKFA